MTNRTAPQLILTAFGEGRANWPYCPPMLEDLKAAVPNRYRDWDPTHKVWTIDPAYVDVAIEILLRHFPHAEVPRRGRTHTTAAHPAGRDHFRVLHLRESAPVELIEASYRVLARIHHPDRGGDSEAMQQINSAYAALRERVSA